jgi:hypothetical protein
MVLVHAFGGSNPSTPAMKKVLDFQILGLFSIVEVEQFEAGFEFCQIHRFVQNLADDGIFRRNSLSSKRSSLHPSHEKLSYFYCIFRNLNIC